jgi:simple sugar transport system permease protein
MKALTKALGPPLFGLVLAIGVGMAILACLGEDPRVLLEALAHVCFTGFGLGYTLFYATPLIFTGLSVAICFRCGLFNIGAEGQLYLGAMAVVLVSRLWPEAPWWVGVPLGIAASFAAGGLWGGLAGVLKAKRGSHEVITTIMLNFIAVAIISYLIIYPFHNPVEQNPESVSVGAGYQIPLLHDLLSPLGIDCFKATPVNAALFVAILAALLCTLLLFRSTFGYTLRAVGFNPRAAQFAGISVSWHTILALGLSGGLAGLVGVNEVMGYQHKVIDGFSPEYGFTGIAVALLARSHPLGVLLSAFLFGALHNSARELEFLSDIVAKELAFVLQGVLIAFVAAHHLYERFLPSGRRRRAREQLAARPTGIAAETSGASPAVTPKEEPT